MNTKTFLSVAIATLLNLGTVIANTDQVITSLADFDRTISADKLIKREPVTFKNQNLKIAGLVFSPATINENKKYPAIIVVHPGGGIKEQTASLYAYNLAKQGFVAIAFDASYQGASEGEPRGLENPTSRVEDVRSAVDYVMTIPHVDKEKIGALGICAGGGYAIAAATTEKRIKAVAGVSAVDFGTSLRNGWRNKNTVADQIKTLESTAKQRTAEANGEKPTMLNYVPEPSEINKDSDPDMVEASQYYRDSNRWMHKNGTNHFLSSSIDKLSAFSAFDRIDTLLTQPLLLVAGSEAGSLWQSQKAYKLAKGSKDLYIVKGGTHMSLYDKDVNKAMPKITEFYGKKLNISTK
jgi:fermentation-respiration switch protein FrsA (DUF1100 family)